MFRAPYWQACVRNAPTQKQRSRGRQALFVVNLPARRMAGEISEAMLLDIGYADGLTPVLAIAEKPLPSCQMAPEGYVLLSIRRS